MALFPATSVEGTLIPRVMMALNLQLLLLLLLPLLTDGAAVWLLVVF